MGSVFPGDRGAAVGRPMPDWWRWAWRMTGSVDAGNGPLCKWCAEGETWLDWTGVGTRRHATISCNIGSQFVEIRYSCVFLNIRFLLPNRYLLSLSPFCGVSRAFITEHLSSKTRLLFCLLLAWSVYNMYILEGGNWAQYPFVTSLLCLWWYTSEINTLSLSLCVCVCFGITGRDNHENKTLNDSSGVRRQKHYFQIL